jgi:hypothetical protein
MMAWSALMAEGVPLMSRLFDPIPPAAQLKLTPLIVHAAFSFSLAAAYLALWWTAPDYRVFRSMGIYLGLVGIQLLWVYSGGDKSAWALVALTAPVLVKLAGEAMRVANRRWSLLIWPAGILVLIIGWLPWLKFTQDLPLDLSSVFLCVLVVQGFRHGQRRDRQIALAFVFFLSVRLTLSPNFRAISHVPIDIKIGSWSWGITPSAIILLGLATLVIFVRDLIEDRRQKQRLGAELEAARSVQLLLIPDEIPSVPGFVLQSIYKPAGQVGGDFFQILPVSGGGVLVVIGDVSGKGMPAAMTVSLLVGTVQTLVHYTQSPAEVLAAINHRMLTRSGGGFTTCLVLRADTDGTLTVANAGHLAPYLDGKELALENGLPLGLAGETDYAESTFQLDCGLQLMLLTDGVVEARDRSGALFGFERAASLSNQPAESIAHAAQAFGQDDDITVLTLARTG